MIGLLTRRRNGFCSSAGRGIPYPLRPSPLFSLADILLSSSLSESFCWLRSWVMRSIALSSSELWNPWFSTLSYLPYSTSLMSSSFSLRGVRATTELLGWRLLSGFEDLRPLGWVVGDIPISSSCIGSRSSSRESTIYSCGSVRWWSLLAFALLLTSGADLSSCCSYGRDVLSVGYWRLSRLVLKVFWTLLRKSGFSWRSLSMGSSSPWISPWLAASKIWGYCYFSPSAYKLNSFSTFWAKIRSSLTAKSKSSSSCVFPVCA